MHISSLCNKDEAAVVHVLRDIMMRVVDRDCKEY